MDINAVKKKLDAMTNKSSYSNNNKNLFWKPSPGKQVIRVVPSKYNEKTPFTEMRFYYGIGEKKVMASPVNWGDKDPIYEFAKQLRGTDDKENWALAKKLSSKVRTFAPVIVRGEESEGVKLWQFGKEVYESFLQMVVDDEIGDYTDVMSGRDIKLTTLGPESTGTPYNRTTLQPSLKTSPLAEDKDTLDKYLTEQTNPMDLFKPLPYDEMKENLMAWLEPEEGDEGEIISESHDSFEEDGKEKVSTKKASIPYSLKPKTSNTDQFNELFGEESSVETEE